MYYGKFVSYKQVIEDVYRDFKFQYIMQPTDAIEWLGSALRMLKVPAFYIDKVTDGNKDLGHQDFIKIEDGRGKLPCDLYSITQTARAIERCENSNCCPIITGISYMDYDTGETCKTGDGSDLCSQFVACKEDCSSCNSSSCSCSDRKTKAYQLVPMRWSTNTFYKSLHGCDLDFRCQSEFTYTVNNNYIFTSFKEGLVAMAYKAVATDEDGFPLIPDNESVLNFCKWFIGYKIAFQLFLEDKYTEQKLSYFEYNSGLYYNKAKNEAKMPKNLDEWESYKNDRIRTIKRQYHHSNFFANMQAAEIRFNHPRLDTIWGNSRIL